jgi:hypothetical protein
MKYILIGLPKSGTTSFQVLFEKLGYQSAHWKYKNIYVADYILAAKQKRLPLLTYLDHLECITQMDICISPYKNFWPQCSELELLLEQYPNITYILPIRPIEKTIRSMKQWHYHGVSYFDRILQFHQIKFYRGNSYDEKVYNWISDHYERCFTLFGNSKNFLCYNIEKDNIDKLRSIIPIPEEIIRFPHKNKTIRHFN